MSTASPDPKHHSLLNTPRATAPFLTQPRPPPGASNWHIPIYDRDNVQQSPSPHLNSTDTPPVSHVNTVPLPDDSHRFRGSEDTLRGDDAGDRYNFSSYQHPYDIHRPPHAYPGVAPFVQSRHTAPRATLRQRRSVSFVGHHSPEDEEDGYPSDYDKLEGGGRSSTRGGKGWRDGKDLGVLSNLISWHLNDRYPDDSGKNPSRANRRPTVVRNSSVYSGYTTGYSSDGESRYSLRREDSVGSLYSQIVDDDDPRITGAKGYLEDPEDVKKNALRQMDYRARRKERAKVRIEFNITSIINRQLFLLKLARCLMTFGAPSHRIESQLVAAAKILEVDAEFIHLPGVIICSFGDEGTRTSETHFVKCGGRLSLGSLHKVHLIYRSVVHDEVSAKEATKQLAALLEAKPLYPIWFRCLLAFLLSALICPLAFGGSFIDMWVAGSGAIILCALQLSVASKSALYANVFEITIAIFTSFTARGLSSIRGSNQFFCYTAISSAGIIGILPGYLILTSSLELASKNIVCGSVKMVYALIYTLFLGFGLQIGSDVYLLLDPRARQHLLMMASESAPTTTLIGSFLVGNSTNLNSSEIYRTGTFTFTDAVPLRQKNVIEGCYRPPDHPWYLQPFPWWSQFIIVPIFSILSSLANLQPWKSKQLPVMVIISCASYATNKIANHYIFNRSDIVSAIGAFTVGLLGNIYSRKMGGTAFTSMVTGVLFLVPSGLSQAGGITAQGSGIDIGGAMIAVTIGITVGLFMSQAFVYMFGSRKNAAVFSF